MVRAVVRRRRMIFFLYLSFLLSLLSIGRSISKFLSALSLPLSSAALPLPCWRTSYMQHLDLYLFFPFQLEARPAPRPPSVLKENGKKERTANRHTHRPTRATHLETAREREA